MRLFRFPLEDFENIEEKCYECGWDTSLGYVLAETEEEAKKEVENHNFLCGSCMAEKIAMEGYIVNNCDTFKPSDYEKIAFFEYLYKVDIESISGYDLTDEEWKELKYIIESDTYIPNKVNEYIPILVDEMIERKKKMEEEQNGEKQM